MTPTTDSHTPTPWDIDATYATKERPLVDISGDSKCVQVASQVTEEDAAFIVEAVNSYASRKARIRRLEEALKIIAAGECIHPSNVAKATLKLAALSDPSGEKN